MLLPSLTLLASGHVCQDRPMDKRTRWTNALIIGAAATVCLVLSGVLSGVASAVFFGAGVVLLGSEAMPPWLAKRREVAPSPLVPGEFSVVLVEPGERRIQVIKALRAVADLDFESAQRYVRTTPAVVVREVSLDGATVVSEALIGSGATARVQKG